MRAAQLVIALYVLLMQMLPAAEPGTFPAHPRLLFNAKDLPALRERAAGRYKTYFQTLKSQADEWLARDIRLPDRGGQWFHWYSCPKHGARLRTETPTRHVCPVDGEVFSGYPYDDVVVSTEHNRLATAVRSLGLVYQLTGDSRYAGKAKEILLAYAQKYRAYPLHNTRGEAKVGGGKVGPQTLDESTWLITVVEGADCIWTTLSAEEQNMVTTGLLLPATEVIREHKMGVHNIQCWKNSAVGLTGLLLGDMRLVEEAVNGESGYRRQMEKGVSADGPWFEGAWGYHFYTLSALLHLTEGAYHSQMNLYGPELKRMFDAPLAMAMPDLTLPAFNDSQTVDLASHAAMYETALARYQDPQYTLITGHKRRETEAAFFHGNQEQERSTTDGFTPFSRNFTSSGNAILSTGAGTNATWLCMKYGPHGGGHGHPDKLNFVLYGLGQVIAPDPGTANYGVPIQASWFRTTLAHNTLTVDGRSQAAAEGRCEAFLATNGFAVVMANAGKIFEDVSYYRTVALVATNLILFIDQVQSKQTHVYDLAYHNRGHLVTTEGKEFKPSQNPGYSHLRDARETTSSGPARVRFDLDNGNRIYWTLAGGETTTVISGTGVGRHTEDRVPMLLARREAKSTVYLWAICFGSEGDRLEVQSRDLQFPDGSRPEAASVSAMQIRHGAETFVLIVNPSHRPVMLGDQKLEGTVMLLSARDNSPPRARHVVLEPAQPRAPTRQQFD